MKPLCLKQPRMGEVPSIDKENSGDWAKLLFGVYVSASMIKRVSKVKQTFHKLLFLKGLQDWFFLTTYFKHSIFRMIGL